MTDKKKTDTKKKNQENKPKFTVPKLEQGDTVQLTVAVDANTDEQLKQIFFDGKGHYRTKTDVLRTAIQHFIDSQ